VVEVLPELDLAHHAFRDEPVRSIEAGGVQPTMAAMMLRSGEHQRVSNRDVADAVRDYTLFDIISRNARLHPRRTAIIFDGRRITHEEYLAHVERLAAGLAAAGIGAGDRLGIVSLNCLEYLDLLGAAARLGAIAVPANWRLSGEEVVEVLNDATPKLVFADAEHQPSVAAARTRLPSVERYYAFGAARPPFVEFDELLCPEAAVPESRIHSDSSYVIIHTAAVAGRARGALLSHRNLIAASIQLIHLWKLDAEDVQLGLLPLFHVTGLGLFLALQQAGGATALLPRFEPAAAVRNIVEDRVTLFGEFAPILANLLDHAVASRADLSSLRVVFGLDTPETIARFEAAYPNARFFAAYGQAETSGGVTFAAFRERPGSAGRPALLSNIAVVDEADRPVPVGETGEIVVRGPVVFKGYWQCDADNAFTFRNGWHHTGDMGRFDTDGYLWYAGRSPAKELIKPGGENVYPAEVERAILEHPAIAEVAVIGVVDPQWGEAVKAVCVCRYGHELDAQDLIEFVGRRIARFKKPKHVTFIARLPRTAAGQIDRQAIKREYGQG
jgi:acyl-CoA synthetase (AMP-forming)/AMP-acid ligase II